MGTSPPLTFTSIDATYCAPMHRSAASADVLSRRRRTTRRQMPSSSSKNVHASVCAAYAMGAIGKGGRRPHAAHRGPERPLRDVGEARNTRRPANLEQAARRPFVEPIHASCCAKGGRGNGRGGGRKIHPQRFFLR